MEYYKHKVAACGKDQRQLYALLNSLLNRKSAPILPHSDSAADLASAFSGFFTEKISGIRVDLSRVPLGGEFLVDFSDHVDVVSTLQNFHQVDSDGVVTKIINKCFEESNFVLSEKESLIHPSLKKPGLDCENMANYRPVSNLTFLSKIIERAMLDQLNPLFVQNGVIPVVQSAYREFHSTETALCKIHNDLVTNTCSRKTSLLLLLDLSAAFDTVDHMI